MITFKCWTYNKIGAIKNKTVLIATKLINMVQTILNIFFFFINLSRVIIYYLYGSKFSKKME